MSRVETATLPFLLGEFQTGDVWSGARDLNPGPHGPEIYAVSSTGADFAGFEFISSRWIGVSNRFRPPMSLELLHELLHEIASTKSTGAPQIWRDKL